MTLHALSNKNKVVLAINVITLLLVNVGGVGLFLTPTMAQAGVSKIWLTTNGCGPKSDKIDYADVANRIFVNGESFSAGDMNWNVAGQTESGDANIVVKNGVYTVDATGTFCFRVYKVNTDDWGKYNVTFGSETEAYQVNPYVAGRVYIDPNVDNNYIGGISWEVKATKGSDTITANTDSSGAYVISLPRSDGNWVVSETLRPGWTQILPQAPNSYSISVDSNTKVIANNDFKNKFTAVVRQSPDMNGDGVVDLLDLVIIGDSYLKHAGNAGFDPRADLDQDGYVSEVDKASFSMAFNDPAWWAAYSVNSETKTDSNPEENIIKPLEPVVVAPLLTQVVTNDATTFLKPGGLVNYTATIKNTGNTAAQNVKVVATLPSGIFFTDSLGTEKTLTSGGALGPNDTMTLKYQGTIKNDAINGIYKDTLTVTADNHSTLNGGSSVEVRLPEVVLPNTTTLDVALQSNVTFVNPGDTIKYTVIVTNTGAAPAVDVRLKMTLPDGQTFVETGSAEREWALGNIAVGGKVTTTVDGMVSETAAVGIEKVSTTVSSVSISSVVSSSINIEVKAPQVLGAETGPTDTVETLAATGTGWADYAMLMAIGMLWLGSGICWYRRRQKMNHATGK